MKATERGTGKREPAARNRAASATAPEETVPGAEVPEWRDRLALGAWAAASVGLLAALLFVLVQFGETGAALVWRGFAVAAGLAALWWMALRDYRRRRGRT